MNKKILLVDDCEEIFIMVFHAVASIADILWAKNVAEAKKLLSYNSFDLLLLDIELPDGNGIELCEEIQTNDPLLPIFFLSSHKDLSEKVLGFSAGADDYITKPFSILELRARIDAKLRKSNFKDNPTDILRWKELQIYISRQEVRILDNLEFKPVSLTSLEFKLLMYFANHPNNVIARDDILNDIWGEDVHVYPRSVDTHVSKLRKKLGNAAHVIQSIHGTGYKFVPEQVNQTLI